MKNFKSNDTAINFLRKNKVRLQSLTAAVIVASSLTGCKKEETSVATSPAEQYINNSIVITTDAGEKNVVRRIYRSGCNNSLDNSHFHYYDVITGNYYSDRESCLNFKNNNKCVFPTYLNITNIESISNYLTTDEFAKLMKDELSIDDCIKILTRIKESTVEEVKTK